MSSVTSVAPMINKHDNNLICTSGSMAPKTDLEMEVPNFLAKQKLKRKSRRYKALLDMTYSDFMS